MPRPIALFLLLTLAAPRFCAAQDEPLFSYSPDVKMNFARFNAFYETMKVRNDTAVVTEGRGAGMQFFFAGKYDNGSDYGMNRRFQAGYSIATQVGYGTKKDMQGNPAGRWLPYELDIGLWASYFAHNQVEIGVQYLPIGIFGYSTYAFFGSSLTGKVRLWHFQFEAAREGDGIFRGCFVPKFNSNPVNHYAVMFLFNHYLYAGVRYLSYNSAPENVARNLTNELRFTIGYGPNW